MKISMISEHASPLTALGGVDAGAQNVHVAALSAALARQGHQLTVFTRRDDADVPERLRLAPGVEVVHVNAGPPRPIPKDEMLPFMPALAVGRRELAAGSRIPVVQTFHAVGVVKRRRASGSADDDSEPPGRRVRHCFPRAEHSDIHNER